MPALRDLSKLLAKVPKGSWVALSHDEERVVAYAADFDETLRKAHEAGENDPVVLRVPETDAAVFL